MQIDITPETERVVREELVKGRFRSIDDLIVASVHALRERTTIREQGSNPAISLPLSGLPLSGREKARLFGEWAESHPAAQPLSDEAMSRESLNPDRW